jgi:hypothetical protein
MVTSSSSGTAASTGSGGGHGDAGFSVDAGGGGGGDAGGVADAGIEGGGDAGGNTDAGGVAGGVDADGGGGGVADAGIEGGGDAGGNTDAGGVAAGGGCAPADLAAAESNSFRSVLRTGVVASGGLRVDVGVGDESGVLAFGGTGGDVPVLTEIGVGAADAVVGCGRAGDAFPLLARPESISFRSVLRTGVDSSSGGLRLDVDVDAGGELGGIAGDAARGGVCDLTDHDISVAAGDDVDACVGAGAELPVFAGGESSGCVRLALTSTGSASAGLRFDGRAVVSAGLRPAADAGELTVVAGAGVPVLTATETAGVAVGETVDVVGCTGAGGLSVLAEAEAEAESGGGVADGIEVLASAGTGGELPFLAGTESGVGARVGGAVTGGPSAELRLEVDSRAEVEVEVEVVRGGVAVLARTESGVVVVGATVDVVGCSETDRGLSDLAGIESRGSVRAGATVSGRASARLRVGADAGVELAAIGGGRAAILPGTESGDAVDETVDVVGWAETARGLSFLGGMSSGARTGVIAAGGTSVGLRIVVGAGIGGVGVLTRAESGVAVGEIADVDGGGTARGSSAFARMGSGPGVRAGVTAAGGWSD